MPKPWSKLFAAALLIVAGVWIIVWLNVSTPPFERPANKGGRVVKRTNVATKTDIQTDSQSQDSTNTVKNPAYKQAGGELRVKASQLGASLYSIPLMELVASLKLLNSETPGSSRILMWGAFMESAIAASDFSGHFDRLPLIYAELNEAVPEGVWVDGRPISSVLADRALDAKLKSDSGLTNRNGTLQALLQGHFTGSAGTGDKTGLWQGLAADYLFWSARPSPESGRTEEMALQWRNALESGFAKKIFDEHFVVQAKIFDPVGAATYMLESDAGPFSQNLSRGTLRAGVDSDAAEVISCMSSLTDESAKEYYAYELINATRDNIIRNQLLPLIKTESLRTSAIEKINRVYAR